MAARWEQGWVIRRSRTTKYMGEMRRDGARDEFKDKATGRPKGLLVDPAAGTAIPTSTANCVVYQCMPLAEPGRHSGMPETGAPESRNMGSGR